MKSVIIAMLLFIYSGLAEAQVHTHPKHNMILMGEGPTVFASHIVYKQPHNYQVLVEMNLPPEVRDVYLRARHANRSALFIFLLDPMDIGQVERATTLTGSFLYEDQAQQRHEFLSHVRIDKPNFRIIYFSELPLSLQVVQHL